MGNVHQRNRRKRHIDRHKVSVGCVDCGYKDHPAALEWDHIDQFTKYQTVGRLIQSASLKTLFAEMRKCEIRCSNCHSIRSFEEKHMENKGKRIPREHPNASS